jgi:hypothetical protein
MTANRDIHPNQVLLPTQFVMITIITKKLKTVISLKTIKQMEMGKRNLVQKLHRRKNEYEKQS